MSNFLTISDYESAIRAYRLNQLIDNNSQNLTDAEEEAIQEVRDHLHGLYDVNSIFAAQGNARPKNVVRWCRCLALYYLYERVEDSQVPDRIVKNYNDTMDTLEAIADGRRSTDLPRKKDEKGNPETKFRWGSEKRRKYII